MLVENLEGRILFNVGVLDHAFGPGGQIAVPAGQDDQSIIVQKNGSLIVAGSNASSEVFLERYHANGRVDANFGSKGSVVLDPTHFSNVLSVALSPDGKIVVIGSDGNGNDFLGRFSAGGKVDLTFGSAGIVPLPADTIFPQAKVETDKSIVVAADDKLTGSSAISPDFSGTVGELFHFTRSGAPDTLFGNNGVITTNLGADYHIGDFELPGKGKIEALFYNTTGDPITSLQRFTANGALDPGYVQDQGQRIAANNANRFLPDGSILSLNNAFTGTLTATHFNSEGVIDPRFGAQGPAMLALPPNAGNSTDRAVVEPGFKLLLVEDGTTGGSRYVALGGLTTNGKIDKPFGRTGVVTLSPAGTILVAAGDGSRVLLLESFDGLPESILAYKI